MDSEKTMDAQLCKDVFKGNHVSVGKMFDSNRQILEGITPRGNSALHIAASRGHCEMVKLLISLERSLLSMTNNKGETPLHKAAEAGELKIVEYFLRINCGAREEVDVESRDFESLWTSVNEDNETALHYAARGGHLEIVEILINNVEIIKGARNNDGETALYMACDHGLTEVAMRLLKEKVPADDYYMRNDGRTCLHVAIATEQEDLALELLRVKEELVKKADESDNTPLHLATLHGCLKVVGKILEIAPESSFRANKEEMYPIHIAAQVGSVQTIKLLIESGPHCMELLGKQNKNALHFALKNENNWDATWYLLNKAPDHGLLINDRDKEGNTALQMALKFVNVKLILYVSAWNMNAVKRRFYGPIFKELRESEKGEQNLQGAGGVSENEIKCSEGDGGKNEKGNNLTNDSAQTLSIIAALLATVTFAALFTIPGGVSSDHGIPVRMHAAALKAFIIADTLAMCFSMLALMVLLDAHFVYLALVQLNTIFGFRPIVESSKIFLQTRGFLIGRTFVFFAFVATMISYATGLYVLVAPRCLWLAVLACVAVFAEIFILFFLQIRAVLKLLYASLRLIATLLLYFTFPTGFCQ